MPIIQIGNNIISFPDNAADPTWSEAIIQFAEAVESSLSSILPQYNIDQRVMNIDSYNVASNISVTDGSVPLLFPVSAFPSSGVRAAFVQYAVYRTNTSPVVTLDESGTILFLYDGATWTQQQDKIGNAKVSFSITNAGQVQFTSLSSGAGTHVGRITYVAQGLKQS